MRAFAVAPVAAIGLLGACTLLTDLDGFDTGPQDAGGPIKDAKAKTDAHADGASEGGPVCDTQSDPLNCGVCGKSCLGGECKEGKCQQAVLARGFNRPLGIGLSQNKLYVGEQTALTEVSLDGKVVTQVVTGLRARYVWGTDTDVFFSNDTDHRIHRWPHSTDGSAPAVTDAVYPGVSGVALAPGFLYFTRYVNQDQGGGVYRVTYPDVGDPELLKSWNKPESCTFADGRAYFAGDGQDSAEALEEDGTNDTLLTRGGPTGIFVLGDDAFITRQGAGQVLRVSITTKQSETLCNDLAGPSGIIATPTAIYWVEIDNGNLGVLVR